MADLKVIIKQPDNPAAGDKIDHAGVDVMRKYVHILQNLPVVLADLISAGETELAQKAMLNWGHCKLSVDSIWQEIFPVWENIYKQERKEG